MSVRITGEAKRHEVVGALEYAKAEIIQGMILQLDGTATKCEN